MMNENNSVIELKELRIGNYLSYNDNIVHVTSISLDIDDEYEDTIGFCKLGETTNEHAAWNRSLYNYLKRIPLTSEWLERFAFEPAEEAPGDGWCEIQIGRHKLQVCINGQCNMINIVDEHDQSVLFRKVLIVQYVHQLQSLYFTLTGEELTIK